MAKTNLRFEVRNELSEWFLDRRKPPSVIPGNSDFDDNKTPSPKFLRYMFSVITSIAYKKLPKYRVYVNQDLIVERDWIWGNNVYIEEDIWADIDLAQDCVLRVEPIAIVNNASKFDIENFQIINGEGLIQKPNNLQVNFRVDKYIDTQLESQ
jgi:hypothetical protein